MRRLGLVGLVCLIAMAGLAAVGAPAQAFTVICTAKTKAQVAACDTSGYAAVMHKMHWRMYGGHNCTNYAAYRMQQAGVPEPRILLGNARDWHTNAKKLGYTVNQRPAVGAIGQWSKRSSHVAYVEEVGNGYLILSEDSYTSKVYRRYKVLTGASWYPERFIHFVTPGTTAPTPAPAPAPAPKPAKAAASVSVSSAAKVSTRVAPKVTVRVAASGGVVPQGRLRVRRGGVTVATTQLTVASKGRATVTIPRMKRGKQWISAVFDGSSTVKPGTSRTIKVTVTKPPKVVSSTTTVSVPATVAHGTRPTVPVVVRSQDGRAMTNAVSVYVDGKLVAAPKLTIRKKGRVSVRLPALAPGAHTVRATYWGSKGVRRSYSKTTRFAVVEPTAVTSSVSTATVRSGQSATVTATVGTARRVAPTSGKVAVLADGVEVAAASLTAASRGTVTIALPTLAPGVRRLAVRYAGSSFQTASVGPTHVLTVQEPSTTRIAGPSAITSKNAAKAKLVISVGSAHQAAAASGMVTVTYGSKVLHTGPMKGAKLTVPLQQVPDGTHRFTATFDGNDLLEPSRSAVHTIEVTKRK
ncbi:Ig-like domain repeat protein [Aeromicrobium sp.]|uniref:Ig-like domain repeat protein n=1 Tax=Aeromicrobium sp. TaxID=1871063 RepID=UPI0028A6701A|nr:Ig-like domain repeat protein [Aeromicrobium sp.]